MNVVYHSSNKFAPVLGVSITSLFENNKNMKEISVYIIEDNISINNKNKLEQIAKQYGRDLFFITMPDVNEEFHLDLKKVRGDWIFNSYCRLFLNKLLPKDIKKVLYLDSDVLILNDLTDLWNTDINNYCLAAVMDYISIDYYNLFGLNKNARYCNSGVLLINLELWEQNNINDLVRDYIKQNNGYVFFMEQTVFNAILQNNILVLPQKYNLYTITQLLTYDEILTLRRPEYMYSREEILTAVQEPCISHMTSCFLVRNRAWYIENNHPMKDKFIYYKNLSPWKNWDGFSSDKSLKQKCYTICTKIIPRKSIVKLAGIIYTKFRVKYIHHIMKKMAAD